MRSIVIATVLLLAGIALDIYGGMDLALAFSSKGWPTADGTILNSEVETMRARRAANYTAKISYSYTVGGQLLSSSQVSFGNEATGDRGDMQALVNRFARGSAVKVHYDPSKPTDACLIAGVESWRDFMPLLIGLLITAGGGFGALQIIGERRQGKSKPQSGKKPRRP